MDVNQIPIGAIERIEVLKDGASAIYGSDAIAGVINIILKSNGSGVSGNVNGGGYDDFIDRMLTSAKNTSATVLNAVDISGYTAGAGEDDEAWDVLAPKMHGTDALIAQLPEPKRRR